jgi:hypothetical protein
MSMLTQIRADGVPVSSQRFAMGALSRFGKGFRAPE